MVSASHAHHHRRKVPGGRSLTCGKISFSSRLLSKEEPWNLHRRAPRRSHGAHVFRQGVDYLRVSVASTALPCPFLCPILLYLSWFISPLSSRARSWFISRLCGLASLFNHPSLLFSSRLSLLLSCLFFPLFTSTLAPAFSAHTVPGRREGRLRDGRCTRTLQPPHLKRCLVHLLHINLGAFMHHRSLSQ